MVRMKRFACLALSASLLVSSVCMDTGAADAVNPAEPQAVAEEVAEDPAEAVDAEDAADAEVKEDAPAQEEVAPEEEKKSEEVADADDAEVKEEDAEAAETEEGDEADVSDADAEAVLDEEAGELETAAYNTADVTASLNGTTLSVDWSKFNTANSIAVGTIGQYIVRVNGTNLFVKTSGALMNSGDVNISSIKHFSYLIDVYYDKDGTYTDASAVPSGSNIGKVNTQAVELSDLSVIEKPAFKVYGSNVDNNGSNLKLMATLKKVDDAASYQLKLNGVSFSIPSFTDATKDYSIDNIIFNGSYKCDFVVKSSITNKEVTLENVFAFDTTKPATVTNIKGVVLAGKIELTWDPVTNVPDVRRYQIFDKATGTRIASTEATSYTITGVSSYGIKEYEVRAFRPTLDRASYDKLPYESSAGKTKTQTGDTQEGRRIYGDKGSVKVNYADPKTSVQTMSFKATVKSTCRGFYNSKTMKVKGKVKKGTKVTCYESYSNRYRCVLPNGKELWINKAKLNLTGYKYKGWEKGQYENNVLESFVNNGGYSSKTPYLIWINQYTQRVAIFTGSQGNWKLERHVKCATGQYSARTPTGTYKIYKREKGWFYKTTYEAPIVLFYKRNAFHSRIKSNRKSNRGKVVDGRIGKPVSHGCIRMYDKDLQFIYSLPLKTTVISY